MGTDYIWSARLSGEGAWTHVYPDPGLEVYTLPGP